MSNITFIGLGSMGRPMALALARAGHNVSGFDVSPASRDAASKLGLQCFDGLTAALAQADVVITMVPTGKHVRQIYANEGGIFDSAPRTALLIDSSTIDVATSRAMHELAAKRGLAFIDAPVTGAVPAAERAALTFMIGGTAELAERATPTLQGMGKAIFHVGPGGSGHAMKICNNMMTGMSMVAISEVFALGERFGLSYQSIFDVVSTGSGSCWSLTSYCPVPGPVSTSPANREYQSNFSMPMMLKDMRLSQEAANDLGASTPLAACSAALYQLAVSNGLSNKDFSAIFELISGRLAKEA
ncbi:putative 3-hydroxyisobutyrate dehydrogenase [compost metagenome]